MWSATKDLSSGYNVSPEQFSNVKVLLYIYNEVIATCGGNGNCVIKLIIKMYKFIY